MIVIKFTKIEGEPNKRDGNFSINKTLGVNQIKL